MNPPECRLPLHSWSSLHSQLVWAYDHQPDQKSRQLRTDHTRCNWAWFIRKGTVHIEGKSGVSTASSGEWLLLPSEHHNQKFSPNASLISLKFICQWPSGENIIKSPKALVLQGSEHPELEQTACQLAHMYQQEFPSLHHNTYSFQNVNYRRFFQFQRVFQDWLEAWLDTRLTLGDTISRQIGDARILSAIRILNDAPLDSGFPQTLLSTLGLGMAQLNRLFRQELTLTLQQYWERRRVEYARTCLENSEMTQKAIAYSLGFSDVPHFNTWFKRHTSTPPGRYRRDFIPI
jgi:AraC-like DNA-binding protein